MVQATIRASHTWSHENRTWWKRYLYSVLAAEVSATTRFSDECVQISPLPHDCGLLFESVDCASKSVVSNIESIPSDWRHHERRVALLLNGNFNYLTDIQQDLRNLHSKLSRHARLFVLAYNPFMSILYTLAYWIGLRQAPRPDVFLTETDLRTFARLAGFEVVRIRPCGFMPIPIPLFSNLVNRILPIIPVIRRLSLAWVVVLRPIIPQPNRPSLSIIFPARNEAGNIEKAVARIPDLPGTELEVVFVEGHSTDDTWQRIQEVVAHTRPRLRVAAYRQTGTGKNDAVRFGFARATGEVVTILDADLTMPPEMLPRFYEAYCQGLGDFINGSRLVYPMEGGAMKPLNRMGNIFFAKALAWVLGLKIGDSLCGTKLFSRKDYERIIAWRNHFGDFDPFGDFEMLFAASELALGVIDVPIRYRARTYGETNIRRFRNGYQLARMTIIGFGRILLGKTK